MPFEMSLLLNAIAITLLAQESLIKENLDESLKYSSKVFLGTVLQLKKYPETGMFHAQIRVDVPFKGVMAGRLVTADIASGAQPGLSSLFFLTELRNGVPTERLPYLRHDPQSWLDLPSSSFANRFSKSLGIEFGRSIHGLRIALVKLRMAKGKVGSLIYFQNTSDQNITILPIQTSLRANFFTDRGPVESKNLSLGTLPIKIYAGKAQIYDLIPVQPRSSSITVKSLKVTMRSGLPKDNAGWIGEVSCSTHL